MYVAPESKVLMMLANVAATSVTGGNGGNESDLPDDDF